MGRVRARTAWFLVAGAAASVFVAAPAQADVSCYPMPEIVCNTQDYYYNCIYTPIRYGYTPPECRA